MAHQEFLSNRGKLRLYFLFPVLLVMFFSSPSFAWLIYHKPAFEGQILDGETKKPIEGAVVVAQYYKRTMGLGAGTISSVINIREVLTDKEGRFRIPSYTTVIQPFSWESRVDFIIYKPGYVSFQYPFAWALEDLFSGKAAGMDKEIEWLDNRSLVFRCRAPNIVELPKPTTREEQIRSLPSIPGPDLPASEMTTLIKYYNMESERLGLGSMRLKY